MTKKNTQLLLELLPISLIIVTFIIGIVLYPRLPESVPSHWGVTGAVDAWTSKNMAVIFFPLLALIIYIGMTLLPIFDPMRENYSKLEIPYFWFRTATVLFLCLLYFYSIWVALGGVLDIVYFIIPVMALYFVLLGFFLPKVKQNYFVGIRTPWTLHSEKAWDMTHKFGERAFVGMGVLSLFTVLIPDYAFFVFIFLVLLAGCSTTVYSYYAFKEVEKDPKRKRK